MQQPDGKPPPKYVSPRWAWITKLVLRVASVVCLIVVAGLFGSLMSNPRIDTRPVFFTLMLPIVRRCSSALSTIPALVLAAS